MFNKRIQFERMSERNEIHNARRAFQALQLAAPSGPGVCGTGEGLRGLGGLAPPSFEACGLQVLVQRHCFLASVGEVLQGGPGNLHLQAWGYGMGL